MQFKGKVINQTKENGKKHIFGHNFVLFAPNLYLQKLLSKFIMH